MALGKKLRKASAAFVDRCSRYEQSGSGQPRLDDVQRHWIEVWGVMGSKRVSGK